MSISFSGKIAPFGRFLYRASNVPPQWILAAGSLGDLNGGIACTVNLSATDANNDPLTYSVVTGALPDGLGISGNQIVGTPVNTPGTYSFTLRVADNYGANADRAFTVTVTNDTPVWTTAVGSLGSFTAGEAVDLSIIATDPNGDAISYSVSSGALPNGLSLSSAGQISGSSTAVGTANFTVTAADGKGGSVDRAFAITITSPVDSQWKYVSLLLPMNNSVNDLGNYGLTATNTNVTFSSGVTKYIPYSAYFDGTGDITVSNAGDAVRFSGDFTVECWFYVSDYSNGTSLIEFRTGSNTSGFVVNLVGNSLSVDYGFTNVLPTVNAVISGQWHHMALCRSGTDIRLFLNGNAIGSSTSSHIQNTSTITIGKHAITAERFTGYVSDVRVTNGYARYTATFTPPVMAFPTHTLVDPNWTSVSLLMLLEGNLTDASASGFTTSSSNLTFDTATKKFYTYSLRLNGTSNELKIGAAPILANTDFTVEGWFNLAALGTGDSVLFNINGGDNGYAGVRAYVTSAGNLALLCSASGSGWNINAANITAFSTGQWHHVAVTRSGTSLKVWFNGVSVYTGSLSGMSNGSRNYIGNTYYPANGITLRANGYVDGFRVTNLARYNGAFQVPKTAFATS